MLQIAPLKSATVKTETSKDAFKINRERECELFVDIVETLTVLLYFIKQLGKAFGIESFILGPEETSKLYPLMNVKDVFGTLYSPQDGTVDPAGYCSALSRAASKLGAKV
jgi:glycine/D-amino acid oxidase-like deaminating enzyme